MTRSPNRASPESLSVPQDEPSLLTTKTTIGEAEGSAFTPGPYSGEFGAIIHEDAIGHLFTVSPAKFAPDVADALNAARVLPDLLEALIGCADDLEAEIKARAVGEFPRRIARDLDTVRKARAALAKAVGHE